MKNLTAIFGQILIDGAEQHIAPNVVADLVYEAATAAGKTDEQAAAYADRAFDLADPIEPPPLSISTAEVNCLLEAIEAANRLVELGQVVYAADGYKTDSIDEQRGYAEVTRLLACSLQQLINCDRQDTIIFQP
ncbi:MAG: hypothetical protein M0P69_19080 [Bacteroidales bacterium]|nr:hypothetical protein [Bacteroidales bacterium]